MMNHAARAAAESSLLHIQRQLTQDKRGYQITESLNTRPDEGEKQTPIKIL